MRALRTLVLLPMLALAPWPASEASAQSGYGYPRAVGPTRDQTSPFGLEVSVGSMTREVYEYQPTGERFEFDVESARILLKATLRPASFLEVYGLFGGADLDSPFDEANFETGLDLAYGGGARITLFRDRSLQDLAVFGEGRYLRHESEGTGEFEGVSGPVRFDEKVRWEEWEGRFGVSWRFYTTRPYLGLRYSGAEAHDIVGPETGPNARRTMRATENIGGFVGIDLYFDPSRRVGLGVEATFPDYTSVTAGLKFWF